jgi:ribosomal-protein-serine acetyltransferase
MISPMNAPKPITTPSPLLPIPLVLEGERVIVRNYRDEDAQPLFDAIEESRGPLRRWMPWVGEVKAVEDRLVYVRKMQARFLTQSEDFAYGIFEKSSGRYLGGTGLHRINWGVPSFEIGYWLRASAHGNGFCTEAARLLTVAAFETLGAARVEVRCDGGNEKSVNVPRRLGFNHEATMVCERRNSEGELSDALIFALTWADWRAKLK